MLDVKGKAKGKLLVVELGGESKAQQTHKVKLQLKPIKRKKSKLKPKSKSIKIRAGGGGLAGRRRGPVYDQIRD